MAPEIPEILAKTISKRTDLSRPISLIWHGGEPLATGLIKFRELIKPFHQLQKNGWVDHHIQTNATMITPQWCEFFVENDFKVGISIDGPQWANAMRVDWGGKEAFTKIMNGINYLKEHWIEFSVIAVVNEFNMTRTKEFYKFFCDLGCTMLGINIEELEGINLNRNIIDNDDKVTAFWSELFHEWRTNPKVRIREFERGLGYIKMVLDDREYEWRSGDIDIYPTIAYNGDVCLLSPELADAKSNIYNDFVAGNVLEKPLETIIEEAPYLRYVNDFALGFRRCKQVCPYFHFCRGGHSANKFFEHGTTNATETMHCRNSKQRLMKAIMNYVSERM